MTYVYTIDWDKTVRISCYQTTTYIFAVIFGMRTINVIKIIMH